MPCPSTHSSFAWLRKCKTTQNQYQTNAFTDQIHSSIPTTSRSNPSRHFQIKSTETKHIHTQDHQIQQDSTAFPQPKRPSTHQNQP